MSAPEIQNVSANEIPIMESGDISFRIISGTINDISGPIQTKAITQIGHLIALGQGEITLSKFEDGHQLMVYVLEGKARIGDISLGAFQLAELSNVGEKLQIKTRDVCQLLIMAGRKLNEPVAFGGPFVMNTQEEITQAQIDFQSGLFGTIK